MLVDFGEAYVAKTGEDIFKRVMRGAKGVPAFRIPEVETKYNFKFDGWSVGVVAYYRFSRNLPFDPPDAETLKAAAKACTYEFKPVEAWNGVSENAKAFIQN